MKLAFGSFRLDPSSLKCNDLEKQALSDQTISNPTTVPQWLDESSLHEGLVGFRWIAKQTIK
jgi:hypothetical protein